MSIYSDYKVGALSDEEFRSLCAWENAKDRYDMEHEFDDYDTDFDEEGDEE